MKDSEKVRILEAELAKRDAQIEKLLRAIEAQSWVVQDLAGIASGLELNGGV